jgi:putative nucleotidyltransferase with HDIG domain
MEIKQKKNILEEFLNQEAEHARFTLIGDFACFLFYRKRGNLMSFYKANFEFVRLKEIFRGEPEWEKAFALFHCLTLRDRVTAEHSLEVGYYAAKIASNMGLDGSRYFLAGMLHDIGKINMDDNPLKSNEVLSTKERKNLKQHVLTGVLLLSELGFGKDVVQFCLRHHERLNGTGYPFNVNAKNTSIEGKIAQVADVFSALTSTRKYRNRVCNFREAFEIMKTDNGAFDQKVLITLEESIDYELKNPIYA